MKLFLLTDGDYSDYRVQALVSYDGEITPELAKTLREKYREITGSRDRDSVGGRGWLKWLLANGFKEVDYTEWHDGPDYETAQLGGAP